jgi:hypothetical protein
MEKSGFHILLCGFFSPLRMCQIWVSVRFVGSVFWLMAPVRDGEY